MNDTTITVTRAVLGFDVGFTVERTGVGRNLNFAGYLFLDENQVDSFANVGRTIAEAEARMRARCENLTSDDVRRIAREEVDAERLAISLKREALERREARCEALAAKLTADRITTRDAGGPRHARRHLDQRAQEEFELATLVGPTAVYA